MHAADLPAQLRASETELPQMRVRHAFDEVLLDASGRRYHHLYHPAVQDQGGDSGLCMSYPQAPCSSPTPALPLPLPLPLPHTRNGRSRPPGPKCVHVRESDLRAGATLPLA